MRSSKFIHLALEGIDGCGKGVQTTLLTQHLERRGRDVVQTQEPTKDTFIGKAIRDEFYARTLPDDELNILFAADRILHRAAMARMVLGLEHPELPIVVSDRSVWSAYAYHGADNSMHDYLSPASVEPDLTVVIDISVELALERMKARGNNPDRFEDEARLQQARAAYRDLSNRTPKVTVVDGTGNEYEVAARVTERVDRWMKQNP